jgi:hypothetical protein
MKDNIFDWMNIKYGIERGQFLGLNYKKPHVEEA